MTPRISLIALLFIPTVLATPACTSTAEPPELAEDELAEPAEPEEAAPPPFETYRHDAELAFEERADRKKATQAIELWKRAVDDESADKIGAEAIAEVYEDLAGAYHFIARYHAADGPVVVDVDELSRWAEDGMDAAAEAVRIRAPHFYDAIQRGAPFEASLPDAPTEAVDALLWYAKNLDLLAKTGGTSRAVSSTPVVEAIMNFVLEHQPDAHFGAAHRFYGIHWVERPFHRDPEASLEAFEKSRNAAPDFLLTSVLQARHLAAHRGDRTQFEALLNEVVHIEDDALPEPVPENRIARQWAKELLDSADEFFD